MKSEIENEQKNDMEREAMKITGKTEMNKNETMFSEATQNDVKQNETTRSEAKRNNANQNESKPSEAMRIEEATRIVNRTENARNKCDKMMDKFLMLDKQERIPLDVTFHLLKCKKCRTQVRYLSKAEKYASEPLKVSVPITDSKISAILKTANPRWSTENFKIKPVSMAKWIVCGILMLLFMTTYTFTAAKLGNEEANTFFYITFGIVITAYCAIFIASNLDFFIKKISSFTDETNCHERRFSGN